MERKLFEFYRIDIIRLVIWSVYKIYILNNINNCWLKFMLGNTYANVAIFHVVVNSIFR